MARRSSRPQLKIVIVGHVDHGKATLVGRLFHDTGSLPEGKLETIRAVCERRGMPFEWAFLMDALQAERDQNITIDTSQIWFRTQKREYVIIDAPGHKEFVKNMVTGAARADAALIIIDASEGVQEQTRRHGYLLRLIGVPITVRPLLVSKINTAAQIVLVATALGERGFDVYPPHLLPALVALVAVTTLVSGAAYVLRGVRLA